MSKDNNTATTSYSMANAWAKPSASLGNGVDTELLVINTAEQYTDNRGESIVTLYCPTDPAVTPTAPPKQIYWL